MPFGGAGNGNIMVPPPLAVFASNGRRLSLTGSVGFRKLTDGAGTRWPDTRPGRHGNARSGRAAGWRCGAAGAGPAGARGRRPGLRGRGRQAGQRLPPGRKSPWALSVCYYDNGKQAPWLSGKRLRAGCTAEATVSPGSRTHVPIHGSVFTPHKMRA